MTAVPLQGDRSAWDVVGFPAAHSSDLPDSPVFHVPEGNTAGQLATWNGTKWVLTTLQSILPPIMTLFTREGDLIVAASPFRIYNKYGANRTITKVFLSATTSPYGDDIICDVRVNGTSIFTGGNRPKILAGQLTGESTTFIDDTWPEDGYVTWEIDQVGSSIAGADLTVHIIHEGA